MVAFGRQGLGNGGVVGHEGVTECEVLVCPRHTGDIIYESIIIIMEKE